VRLKLGSARCHESAPLAQFCGPHKYFSLEYDETPGARLPFIDARVRLAGGSAPTSGEYIILIGGPSMYQWENTRLTRTIIGGEFVRLRVCAPNNCKPNSART